MSVIYSKGHDDSELSCILVKKNHSKEKEKKEYTAQTHKSLHVRLRMGQEVKELPLIFQGRFLPAKDRASSNYFAHTGYLMRLSTL